MELKLTNIYVVFISIVKSLVIFLKNLIKKIFKIIMNFLFFLFYLKIFFMFFFPTFWFTKVIPCSYLDYQFEGRELFYFILITVSYYLVFFKKVYKNIFNYKYKELFIYFLNLIKNFILLKNLKKKLEFSLYKDKNKERDIIFDMLVAYAHFIDFKIYMNDCRKFALKKYVYTINHKRIAINYFFFSFWSGLAGGALATFMRFELAYPGSSFFKGDSLKYLQVIAAHGLIMVFFVVVPILFGGFANFLIPYHIGSKDVAYPRLNSIGFWILPCGFLLITKVAFLRPQFWKYYEKTSVYFPLMGKDNFRKLQDFKNSNSIFFNYIKDNYKLEYFILFLKERKKIKLQNYDKKSFTPPKLFIIDDFMNYPETFWYIIDKFSKIRRRKVYFTKCSNRTLTTAGWTFITPFSSNPKFTGYGSQDILVISVIFAGISTTLSFTNLLVTKRTYGASGLRNRKVLLPFISISLFLVLRMLAVVTPVLAAAMIMLLMDRHWQTTFFEFVYGGDTVLFQHLFWFFGHPEVYILIIPTFGFINMILPNNNTRRIASKHHLIWAIYIMAYMGFLVWGHHMYLVGLDHRSRSLYSTITIMISLPATIKTVNWTLTLLNGALRIDAALLLALSYVLVFIVGGFTGMWLSHVGLNISMHDTYYVVAHFHLMLAGNTIIGIFAGFYFYFHLFFNINYSRIFSFLHSIYYVGGQWLTFLPMFWLGFGGLPRRIHDYPIIFTGWQTMATTGHFITLLGIIFFFFMLLDTHLNQRLYLSPTLGIPRWHKRSQFYSCKTAYLQISQHSVAYLPIFNYRKQYMFEMFNEYEYYRKRWI